jgi:predicted ATPase
MVDTKKAENHTSQAPLVGREAALTALQTHWENAQDSKGHTLVITGESGVGKTRLMHLLADQARQSDKVRVAYVPCRGSRYHPDQPLIELACTLLGLDCQPGTTTRRSQVELALEKLDLREMTPLFARLFAIPPASGLLARVKEGTGELPEEEEPTEKGPKPQTGGLIPRPADDPRSLASAIGLLLDALAKQEHAVLLIFDDFDQVSEKAWKTIRHLLKRAEGRPVLLLAAVGPELPPVFKEAFGENTLTLSPLTREQTNKLGASLFGAESLAQNMEHLFWHNTAGNPLYIHCLAEILRETRRIALDSAENRVGMFGTGPLPTEGDIILQKASRLPKPQQSLLNSAAVLGDGQRIGALGRLSGQQYDDTFKESLAGLVKGGWLEQSGSGRYAIIRFTNRATRRSIYNALQAEQRAAMHRQAGDYYAIPLAGNKLRAERAISHYLRAKTTDRALHVLDLALVQAVKLRNREEAVGLYRRGIEVAGSDPKMVDRQARYAEALGDVYTASGEYGLAAQAYELNLSTIPLALLSKLGMVLLATNPARAVNVLMQVAPATSYSQSNDLRWRLEAGLVWGLAITGRAYEAVRRSRDVLGGLSDTAGFGNARTLMRGTLGMVLYYQGDQAAASTHLESARAGWSARGEQEGVLLINQVFIAVPKKEVTRSWLRMVMAPLLSKDALALADQPV